MKFKIPNKFNLGGTVINVEKVNQISGMGTDCDGMAFYSKSKIELKDDETFSSDYKDWVFWHELVHFIFDNCAEPELRTNEKLVDKVATALHQSIKTME